MNKLKKLQDKTLAFVTVLKNAYRDEDKRESVDKIKLVEGEDLQEDFIAMLIAMNTIFENLTGNTQDIISFTHILNRLAIQHVMNGKEERNE